jgi:hypothetical protein
MKGLLNEYKKFEIATICSSRTVRTVPYRTYRTRQHCNSATLQFQVLMSMQMDAYLKKEQIGTLFVHVGLLHGGSRGGWVGQGGPEQF